MISIKELLTHIINEFTHHNIPNPTTDSELLLSHFLKTTRSQLYLESDTPLPDQSLIQIKDAVAQRCTRKPLQYILGEVTFLNHTIKVTPDVLIPRPETEYMVDTIIKLVGTQFIASVSNQPPIVGTQFIASVKTTTPPKTIIDLKLVGTQLITSVNYNIIDLCTGSGCIAIALKAHYQHATVLATDISEPALTIAKANAQNNHVDVDFIHTDLFPTDKHDKYDLIVSNPPYISENEYTTLQPELLYEPKIALLAEKDGLFFMDKILKQAMQYLTQNGVLYMEIAENLSAQVQQIATECGYKDIEIIKDLCEKDRILRCKR